MAKKYITKSHGRNLFVYATLVVLVGATVWGSSGRNVQLRNLNLVPSDTPKPKKKIPANTTPPDTTLHYPIQDRSSDFYTTPPNPLDLKDPPNIQQNIEYNPDSNDYEITEMLGDQFYRDPNYMSFQDFLNYQSKLQDQNYFQEKSNATELLAHKGDLPTADVSGQLLNRLFGGSNVNIKPQGTIGLTFGGQYQNVLNPTLTRAQQRQGGFNFNMNIAMNVTGTIGTKLKLTTNYNTQATFDFENQVKLDYTGDQDQIIKKIEAGNVSLPISSQLIQGSQSLFGMKAELQFGRLSVTTVISQQKSQQQSVQVQGGAQTQSFNIKADAYDQYRNYLLAQYFRNTYNKSLATIPIISSGITITRIEVWVTNQTGVTTNARDVLAFADLGENQPFSPNVHSIPGKTLPYAFSGNAALNSNDLYNRILANTAVRNTSTAIQTLTGSAFNLTPVQDFEKTYGRLLSPTEYTFQPQLGYILLNQQLNPDQVLAVAYQYTYNGQVYQVGEFSTDVPANPTVPNVLYLKLLKATSVNPKLPIWQLMMKNIYSLNAAQINSQNFKLDITYQDPAGGLRRYIPVGNLNGIPLLSVLGLDRLNSQNEPQPDGIFDFIDGVTISAALGKVIFPVLEPFGKDLASKFTDPLVAKQYVYQVLYDSTNTVALQFPQFDRYSLLGSFQSSVSNIIQLGAFNIPQGSVNVTAGGQLLVEGVDYSVDYNLGQVTILNQGILNSGVPISINFENNALFSFETQTLFGARFDYYVNDKIKLGGTFLHLSERPYTTKLLVGEDPISNSIAGVDGSYTSESGWLTNMLNRFPTLNSKSKSTITISGEAAKFIPGHPAVVGADGGTVYIDDFEGAESSYDLRFPFISWALSSVPYDPNGGQFPEAGLTDSLRSEYRRAKISWFSIDPLFFDNTNPSNPTGIKNNPVQQDNFYTRQIQQTEIFPQEQNPGNLNPPIQTFDLFYQPTKRGSYNFRAYGLNTTPGHVGDLLNPQQNFGGIMRALDITDFQDANVEYVHFWMLDPYLYNPTASGGELYVNLGDVSEDVLKDGQLFYENGIPDDGSNTGMDSSVFSYYPINPPITNAFDNNASARQFQDVGYDGRNDAQEHSFDRKYLDSLQTLYGANSPIYQNAYQDPASDDYAYYLAASYNSVNAGILQRYTKYNGPDGNSPIAGAGETVSQAETNLPESEDLNHDNTLNETEQYFQYKVDLKPNMPVGSNFITDKITTNVYDPSTKKLIGPETWYEFKIPITGYTKAVGGINGFQSIRFMRMYLTDFTDSVDCRFAALEFVRNQWRQYQLSLVQPGEYTGGNTNDQTSFNVSSVSLQANSSRTPVNYVIPPGVQLQEIVGPLTGGFQNESSIALQIINLQDGDARAIYKNLNLDMRQYSDLRYYMHAESIVGQPSLQNGDVTGFIRLGSDYTQNFYEYEVPLQITPPASYSAGPSGQAAVWPTANTVDINLKQLTALKLQRDNAGYPLNVPYTVTLANGTRITILGNPDLGLVAVAMLGVRNPKQGTGGQPDDDGQPKSTEVWIDELRLTGFNEQGGYAAVGRMDIKLADLGTITLAGNMHTVGFGSLDQRVDQRYKDNFFQYNVAASIDLGKLFPKFLGLQIPTYAGISTSISNPQYDPYEYDVLLQDRLDAITNVAERDSVRQAAQTFSSIRSLNFTNVRRQSPSAKVKINPLSLSNFNISYAYTQTLLHNPTVLSDIANLNHGELAYNFGGKDKFISPFKKLIKSNSKWFALVKDFNFNFLPTGISVKTDVNRLYEVTQLRPISALDNALQPLYNKQFSNDRFYAFKLDLTKSLNFTYNATANALIDEPAGSIDTKAKKDSIYNNILKLGRLIHFHETSAVNYNLPTSKFPLTDWTQVQAHYSADYDWLATPQILDSATGHILDNPLGNTLSNIQNFQVTASMSFTQLYDKAHFLAKYDNPGAANASKTKPPVLKPGQKPQPAQQNANQPQQAEIGPEAIIIKPLLMLKKIDFQYGITNNTSLPGFINTPNFAGQALSSSSPGWNFIFGYQPDTNWLKAAGRKGWITKDTALNFPFIQNKNKNITARATLQPISNLNIDLNFTDNYTENATEFFKQVSPTSDFENLNRIVSGTYTISFISLQTAFQHPDANNLTEAFKKFESYRQIISNRLAAQNPNSQGIYFNPSDTSFDANFHDGYGPFSQDVLIPAFLAAYTNQNPQTIPLGLQLNKFPLPNWHITLTGLEKYAWFQNIFSSFNITHGYTSTYSVTGFSTSLYFQGINNNGTFIPSVKDSASNNFIPYYLVPSITINEQFAPLIGVDITWFNNLTTQLQYSKSRALTLLFSDYQLSEAKTQAITVGLGYRAKNFIFPFLRRNGKPIQLKNDVVFNLAMSYSNNYTLSYRLDQIQALPTEGLKSIEVNPTIDYVVNNRLNLHFFFDKRYSIPTVSSSYPIRYTNAGITLQFTLQ